MPRITLWRSGKSADYHFQDRAISEFFNASGTGVYVHKYLGTYGDGDIKDVSEIQDVVFLENRDRKYSDEVFELRGTYNVQDNDFDLRQFGLFLTGDTLFIEFHTNDMMALLGRKLMPGDVLELPHQRDDTLLDEGKAINKFYVVEDASRASDGYSTTWLSHIWRTKVAPMTNSQEYNDILDKANKDPFGLETGDILREVLGEFGRDMQINEQIVEEAETYVHERNFDTTMFYVVPGDETEGQYPWIFAGDGIPPNGAYLIGSGNHFPEESTDGDYFLRTDYSPNALFKKVGSAWRIQELDYRRGRWSAMHRVLEDFFNETGTSTMEDGTTSDTKVALSKTVRPDADF